MTARADEKAEKFYLCKFVTVFGRVSAISRICFICRTSCEAMSWSHSYLFKFPKNGRRKLYLLMVAGCGLVFSPHAR